MFNRYSTLNKSGLIYEVDPRHIDLLSSAFKLEKAKSVGTPGVKEKGHENHAEKGPDTNGTKLGTTDAVALDSHSVAQHSDAQQSDHVKSMKMPTVKLSHGPDEVHDVIPYSCHYPLHPSKILITKSG